MKPPLNAEIFETPLSTYWLDEDGILNAVSKNTERKVEHYNKSIELFQQLTQNGGKLCLLVKYGQSMKMGKDVVEFITSEHPKYLKAIAIVTSEPLGSAQTQTFLKMNFSGFPVCKFPDKKTAKDWLKEVSGKG